LGKLEEVIKKEKSVPMMLLTVTNNAGGGQPVSMENIKEASGIGKENGIPLYFDACRFAENSYFIKTRERGYKDKAIQEIASEMFSYGEGTIMSAKKDALVNMGGFFTGNNKELMEKMRTRMVVTEGFPTYGGLTGRDLEAVAVGLKEGTDFDYLHNRCRQVKRFGDKLIEAGLPVIQPPGRHAIYLDGAKFFPNIPQNEYPALMLGIMLYLEGGVRGVELGNAHFGYRDEKGKEHFPKMDLFRLAIPRRVYTDRHLDFVANSLINLYKKKNKIKRGTKMVYEAPVLRDFTARFEML
jgi:tyrosine phenol-lyase